VNDEYMIERLDAFQNRFWSEHGLGGTIYFDESEEFQIYCDLFGTAPVEVR